VSWRNVGISVEDALFWEFDFTMGGYLYLYNCMSAFVFLDSRNGLTRVMRGV
jgi:hypothetical protein